MCYLLCATSAGHPHTVVCSCRWSYPLYDYDYDYDHDEAKKQGSSTAHSTSQTAAWTASDEWLEKTLLGILWAIFLRLGMRRCRGMLLMAYSQICAPLILQMLIASARATRRLRRVFRLLATFPMALYPPGLYMADSKCRQLYASKGIPPRVSCLEEKLPPTYRRWGRALQRRHDTDNEFLETTLPRV